MPTYIQNQSLSQITEQKRGVGGAVKAGAIVPAAAHLGLTLDASISMRNLVDPAIEAVNRLLAEQKEINPRSWFTSTSFGDYVRPIIENAALAERESSKHENRARFKPHPARFANAACG